MATFSPASISRAMYGDRESVRGSATMAVSRLPYSPAAFQRRPALLAPFLDLFFYVRNDIIEELAARVRIGGRIVIIVSTGLVIGVAVITRRLC